MEAMGGQHDAVVQLLLDQDNIDINCQVETLKWGVCTACLLFRTGTAELPFTGQLPGGMPGLSRNWSTNQGR